MKAEIRIGKGVFGVDLGKPLDISIPIHFNGEQPNAYSMPRASAGSVRGGSFVGDTRQGGSCNVEEFHLIPHCNGTHTECVGHIALERISIHSTLECALLPATVVSLPAIPANETKETCRPEKQDGDLLLTKSALQKACRGLDPEFARALVIRTLPNPEEKKRTRYDGTPPPYFTVAAMQFINGLKTQHLLVDVPSVDRTIDEGKMTCHHIYWDVNEGSHDVSLDDRSRKTITEMIYVPDAVKDGTYLLNLQISSFVADASPSRPLLFEIQRLHE